MTRLGPDDSGAPVDVAAGDVVEAVLPQNAGTGYVWQLDPLPAALALVGDETEVPAAAGAGATGRRRFTVRADGPGTLTARLRREWEPVAAAASVWSVEIRTV